MNLPERWIWLPTGKYPDYQATHYSAMSEKPYRNYCVAEFSKAYHFAKKVTSLTLRFSGDTAFEIYLNDKLTATGPVPVAGDFLGNDFPRGQHYMSEITLMPDSADLNFYARVRLGPVSIHEYSKGHGGFMLGGLVTFEDGTQDVINTDSTWLARKNGAYTKPFEFDGTIPADEWVNAENTPDIWHPTPAPLRQLTYENVKLPTESVVVPAGETTEAVIEIDRIYAAILGLTVKAQGRVNIEVTSFEKEIDHRSKTEAFVFDSDCEYRGLQIHSAGGIRIKAENLSDSEVQIIPTITAVCYPVFNEAKTVTNDEDINLVLDVCAHTLKFCRQHIHLDSPCHYEPLACTGDYYIESLMTAFSFGDMDLAKFDIIRTAELIRNNSGRMFHTTYSLIWVQMLYDVYMLTGDRDMLEKCEDALLILLNLFHTYLGNNGIIENPPDYMFIDWLYIDEISLHHPPKSLGQSCLNMFYFGALETAVRIFDILDNNAMACLCRKNADNLKKCVNEVLFDKEKQMYIEGLNTPTPENLLYSQMPQNTEKIYYRKHANILAAYFGICDKEMCVNLIDRIMSDDIQGEYQAYFAHYLLEAVYRNSLRDKYTLELVRKWIPHVKECSKGLTEGFIPPEPTYSFDHSHAWGGSPLYSLPLALTGLKVMKPDFTQVSFSPSLLGLKSATVEIPTPYGIITVTQEKGKAPVFSAPEEIEII